MIGGPIIWQGAVRLAAHFVATDFYISERLVMGAFYIVVVLLAYGPWAELARLWRRLDQAMQRAGELGGAGPVEQSPGATQLDPDSMTAALYHRELLAQLDPEQ